MANRIFVLVLITIILIILDIYIYRAVRSVSWKWKDNNLLTFQIYLVGIFDITDYWCFRWHFL